MDYRVVEFFGERLEREPMETRTHKFATIKNSFRKFKDLTKELEYNDDVELQYFNTIKEFKVGEFFEDYPFLSVVKTRRFDGKDKYTFTINLKDSSNIYYIVRQSEHIAEIYQKDSKTDNVNTIMDLNFPDKLSNAKLLDIFFSLINI